MGYKLTLEIPIFLSTIGFMLTVSINSNLLIYRTCYVLLHYNKTECALLGFVNNNDTEHLEELVEPTSTYISLVKTIMESAFGSVLCLFIAPWSDRFGRKPVMLLAFVGGTISLLLHIVFAAVENLTPWFILVLSVPVLVTGGGASFSTILYAYITDSTNKKERAIRMGIFEAAMAIATLVGNSMSSYLLIATNYVFVYSVATIFHVLALIYTIFFVPESLREREVSNPVAGFFDRNNFIEMIKTPFKARENCKRTILLLIMATMLLGYMCDGSMNIFFYFLRKKLHWTLKQFTWFGTITNILGIVGSIFVVYLLHTVLNIKESILICFGSVFSVVSLVTFGFAVKDWQIYLAAILNLPASGHSILMRSLISKLVHKQDMAKVLSAFSIGSNILGPLSSIGYTTLYNATIDTDPGLFNFVSAAFSMCSALLFMLILVVQHNTPIEYVALRNDENTNDASEPHNNIASDVSQSEEADR